MFQSTPDQLVGRFPTNCTPSTARRRFNPRPTNWSGDLAPHASSHEPAGSVSIHARPIGRAISSRNRLRPLSGACFNPRPTNWSGDLSNPAVFQQAVAGFNPRPTNWSGDFLMASVSMALPSLFQSTPDQLVGRFDASFVGLMMLDRFQSTPDQLVGRFSCQSGRSHD